MDVEGLRELIINIVAPLPDDELRARSKANLARALPYLDPQPIRPETLVIVASGPTARNCPIERVQAPTMALNGAMALFTAKGLAPTYWCALDPNEVVADFIVDPPKETIYLVSGNCHPTVFERLRDRNVMVWCAYNHNDPEAENDGRYRTFGGMSVTLASLSVARALGFRDLHVWGWDCCYVDGASHASGQGHKEEHRPLTIGDRTFDTTTVWAKEMLEAQELLGSPWCDWSTNIFGNGMVAHYFAWLSQQHYGKAAA